MDIEFVASSTIVPTVAPNKWFVLICLFCFLYLLPSLLSMVKEVVALSYAHSVCLYLLSLVEEVVALSFVNPVR